MDVNLDELELMGKDELKEFVKERGLESRVDMRRGRDGLLEEILDALTDDLPEVEEGEDSALEAAVAESKELADQVDPEPDDEEDDGDDPEPEALAIYRVAKATRYVIEGVVYRLSQGAIVSETSHDLDALRMQGAVLEEIAPDDLPPPIPQYRLNMR